MLPSVDSLPEIKRRACLQLLLLLECCRDEHLSPLLDARIHNVCVICKIHTGVNQTVGPVTSRSLEKRPKNTLSRVFLTYILGQNVDLLRNVTLSRFRFLLFLDSIFYHIAVFEQFLVAIWAKKLTI